MLLLLNQKNQQQVPKPLWCWCGAPGEACPDSSGKLVKNLFFQWYFLLSEAHSHNTPEPGWECSTRYWRQKKLERKIRHPATWMLHGFFWSPPLSPTLSNRAPSLLADTYLCQVGLPVKASVTRCDLQWHEAE